MLGMDLNTLVRLNRGNDEPMKVVLRVNHWIPDVKAKSIGVVERRMPAKPPTTTPETPGAYQHSTGSLNASRGNDCQGCLRRGKRKNSAPAISQPMENTTKKSHQIIGRT